MAIKRFTGHFRVDTSGTSWAHPEAAYDGNYTNAFQPNSKRYAFKFSLSDDEIDDFSIQYHQWNGSTVKGYSFYLAYGDENNQTQITEAVTYKPNANEVFTVPFNLTNAEKDIMKAHKNELLFVMQVVGSYTSGGYEIEIVVPDSSKIFLADKNATAAYIGSANADVYIGTTKIL